MKAITNTLIIILLLANGLPALISGWQMMSAPDGSKVFLEPSVLHGIFPNFLLPGIVLFFAIGLGSIASIILMISRNRLFPLSVLAEGLIVFVYVVVEIGVMKTFEAVQQIYLGLGVLLFMAGLFYLLRKRAPAISRERYL